MFSLLLSICYFIPPTGWEIAKPKHLSEYVQVGFIGKGSNEFRPSINIAFETVDVPLKEYVKAVKEIHKEQPNTQWRDLGKFPMQGGEGRLTEITSMSPWGEIKTLQAILVKENKAYLLTGAVLKQDFPKFQKELLNCFRTLNLTSDLFSPLAGGQKEEFQEIFQRLGHFAADQEKTAQQQQQWEQLQKAVAEKVPQMGGYWHFLVLKEGYAKIYSSTQ
ncbi:MAG TPA: hypothetical protein VLE89_05670 [Chlamydiales bacterium]|nr:hypothetical protein [Chlamydiales bacterium]